LKDSAGHLHHHLRLHHVIRTIQRLVKNVYVLKGRQELHLIANQYSVMLKIHHLSVRSRLQNALMEP
jgi:hypothetical protein